MGDPIYSNDDEHDSDLNLSRTYLHATGLHIAPTGEATSALCNGVLIWCPPDESFLDLWPDDADKAGFGNILSDLVHEHCESEELRVLASATAE